VVPDAAAQKEAEKVVRDVFKEEFSKKTPAARVALARKLLQQGIDTQDNEPNCYVLLREAGDLAALSGESTLALQAISELSKRFQVNGIELKLAALAASAKVLKTPEEFAGVARGYLGVVEDALAAEEYDSAERGASAGVQVAKKAKDLALVAKIDSRGKEVAERKSRAAKVTKALEALGKNPSDGEAHLVVGQFFFLVKNDWAEALPHLAQGADAALKAAAEKDLSNPIEQSDQIAVGDVWWDLSEKATAAIQARLRSRACYWYLKPREQTSGITRTKIDKRLDAAGLLPPIRPAIDLLKLIDLQRDIVQGRWQFIDGKLVSPAVFMARVEIPYAPPEEYDLHIVVECEGKQDSINLGLVTGESRVLAAFDAADPPRTTLSQIENQEANEAVYIGKVIVPGKPNTLVCSVRKNRLILKVNDKTLVDWAADYKRVSLENVWGSANSKALVIGAYLSIFRFSKISLVPVSGEGKKLR